jgi:hypothetical protein
MRTLLLAGLLITLAGCNRRAPAPPESSAITAETIRLLKTPDDPYRNIYYPPVSLAKPPVTSGPASSHRG